jgi:hypothetical protein
MNDRIEEILEAMLAAVKAEVGDDLEDIMNDIIDDFELLAIVTVRIEAKVLAEVLDELEAKSLMRMRRNAFETELLKYRLKGKVLLERAINAALSALREMFEAATDIVLPF